MYATMAQRETERARDAASWPKEVWDCFAVAVPTDGILSVHSHHHLIKFRISRHSGLVFCELSTNVDASRSGATT